MSFSKFGSRVHDERVLGNQVHVPDAGALGQTMRRRVLQILGQHGAQRFARTQAALGRHEYVGFAPSEGAVFVVGHQNTDAFLLALYRRRDEALFRRQESFGFFFMGQLDDKDAADQNADQQQCNGDLKVARDHGCPPVCVLFFAIPAATADATEFCNLPLYKTWTSFGSAASSTASAGATILFSGRNGEFSRATGKAVLCNSCATASARALLRASELDCAASQGRKRPVVRADGSSDAYTRTPDPGAP